ncbi:MAG: right-handed parallel beta-helix repeat-containing protein [Tepidisphaeraceae bacterium]
MIETCEIRRLLAFDITAYGAATSKPDNTSFINAAIQDAFNSTTDKQVFVPGGQFKYLGTITIKPGVELLGKADFGGTSTRSELRHVATDGRNANIILSGDGPKLRKLWITSAYDQTQPNARQPYDDTVLVRAVGASNYYIERCEIQGGASAGIKSTNASSNGHINSNKVHDTLADGIHTVHGSHHISITNNTVSKTGDDMISVVSYDPTQSTFGICYSITIQGNNCDNALGNNGRGITVVGGNTITIDNNIIANAPHAGLYIVSENTANYHTLGVNGVTVTRNTITNANRLSLSSHAGIFIKGRDSTYPVVNITIGNATDGTLGNTVTDSTGQSVSINANTDTIKLLRNTFNGSSGDGIKVLSSKNLQINNNTIKRTNEHGIHFQSGSTGTVTVNNNQFIDINRTNTAARYVVYFASHVTSGVRVADNSFSSITVTGNSYTETVNYNVTAYIFYLAYTATVSGNTTTTGTPNNPA